MPQPKKLIEVAMPVKEISAESVRDKSIRHGHISTLHLWWARRPLPVCRAVVFASLVPDPMDKNCHPKVKNAIKNLLGKPFSIRRGDSAKDWYKPYDDIPHTAAVDPMEDSLRNRLLMFIGKFSDKYIENERVGKSTPAKDQLSDASLIKWDNKNNESILNIARKIIWVSHDPEYNTISEFDKHWTDIKNAENELYSTPDRHLMTDDVIEKEKTKDQAIQAFLNRMPKVFDPFAGGGAIPLEAARLGCRSYGNDINPIAHVIEQCCLYYPQKYGKPFHVSKSEFKRLYPDSYYDLSQMIDANLGNNNVLVKNRLAFDVAYYSHKIVSHAKAKLSFLYSSNKNTPLVYFWYDETTCSNPTCKKLVPLIKNFYLSKRRGVSENEYVHLNPIISDDKLKFEIGYGTIEIDPWISGGNVKCPFCGAIKQKSQLKEDYKYSKIRQRLIALLEQSENGHRGFRIANSDDLIGFPVELNEDIEIPDGSIQPCSAGGDTISWSITRWKQIFNNRQLIVLTGIKKIVSETIESIKSLYSEEYHKAIATFLGVYFNRILIRSSAFGKWHLLQETAEHLYGKQSLQMGFDYPEVNLFSSFSNAAINQIPNMIKVIEHESYNAIFSHIFNCSSGDHLQFDEKSIDYVVTDPPYYDAIAYADVSDFFYIWLKDIIGKHYPFSFATPQTPKVDECTALKHHHHNSKYEADSHFESTLQNIFSAIQLQTKNIISIMFAHQSTQAWITLCNSILGSSMNITGSWAIETEQTVALKSKKAYLASSVTVSCKPTVREGFGYYKEIEKNILKRIKREIKKLYLIGFRGADLLTACFGQAVSEFGQYEQVEKADGSEVTVKELLDLARDAAFNAIISDIETDDYTRFYIGWLNLFGFSEADHDDVRRITMIGLSIDTTELLSKNILTRKGNKETLAAFSERIKIHGKLGLKDSDNEIDRAHRMMHYFKSNDRKQLLNYIAQVAPTSESSIWRILNSLFEVLPAGSDDHKQVSGLLTNKTTLIQDAKSLKQTDAIQSKLEF